MYDSNSNVCPIYNHLRDICNSNVNEFELTFRLGQGKM